MNLRDVRPTDDFYRDVDQALVLAGEPMSRTDFGLYVLPGILGRFATGWDSLPMLIPGRPDYRVLIAYSGHLGAYAVEGQRAWDGVIELTSLTVDPATPSDEDLENAITEASAWSQFWSQLSTAAGIHQRPHGRGDLRERAHRTAMNAGRQFSKACEGASPPWVHIPPPLL